MINKVGKIVGKSVNEYSKRTKSTIDELKFKEAYQGRIIDCMVGEVDDNYIETPETNSAIVKLEHSKEGFVKIPSIKGKTILVDVEGNETDTPAEGCRLVSVGEDEDNKLIILSKNKNLFDRNNVVSTIFGSATLDWNRYNSCKINVSVQSWQGFKIMNLDKNKSYYLSYKATSTETESERGMTRCAWYDSNNVLRQWRVSNNTNQRVGGLIQDTTEINFGVISINNALNTINIIDIQLEETSKTDYVEPKSHKTEILLDEPLRSLPNGVCDEIVGNKLIRRIGKVVFNGTKYNWNKEQTRYWTSIKEEGAMGNGSLCFCNRYEHIIKVPYGDIAIGQSRWGAEQNIMFNEDNGIMGTKEFKKSLEEKPITLLFELAEPVIIEMPNALTLQGFDDTTMYIENSITPTIQYGYNALIPYKEELSKQKEEVETNTLDIENNIVPYLMDMEYNLMLMEDN